MLKILSSLFLITLGLLKENCSFLGGDGRYFNLRLLQTVLKMAAAHGVACGKVGSVLKWGERVSFLRLLSRISFANIMRMVVYHSFSEL